MDYEKFEQRYKRREAARSLLDRMGADNLAPAALYAGDIPGDETVTALFDEWLPVGFWTCLRDEHPACGGPIACAERCTTEYWRQHCRDVAGMLERLAATLGQDQRLWRFTGLVHDLDYLKGKHHDLQAQSDRAHPLGIARQLFEFGVPPVVVLAVLEHSPHLGLAPSSALSNALIACDEHATMTAEGQTPEYPDDISRSVLDCMLASAPTVDGWRRDDMQDRATASLRALA